MCAIFDRDGSGRDLPPGRADALLIDPHLELANEVGALTLGCRCRLRDV